MKTPKISIVTPSFNQRKFIDDTIESVLGQNYPNLEFVIIDGGSTDGSVDIIKKYEKDLHYWVSEKDEGHGHALNKGFSKTSGEIMAWINSDDKYTPWTFKTVAEIFTQFPHVEWISGLNTVWNWRGTMINTRKQPKNIYDYLTGNFRWIQQESVFWRRSLWEKAGGYINDDYKLMVDGELWTRFFLYADLYGVDCILGGYRAHDVNRAKLNYSECLLEMEKAIDVMRKSCPKRVINNSRKLKIIEIIKKMILCKRLRIFPPFHRQGLFRLIRETSYKNIYFGGLKEWVERSQPFNM